MIPSITNEEFALMRDESKKVGNKAANLKILEQMTQKIPYLTVPPMHAVSHQTISDFLEKQTRGEFQAKWKEFCKEMSGKDGLSQKSRSLLKKIETLVKATFLKRGSGLPDIQVFLGKIPSNCRTIIRSTGREDTAKLANAGGNKTCINIPPNPEDIAEAIGKVVASYFSTRSIGQRLQAGDDVAKKPFVPVLLQVMVKESEKVIPSSGVIFSDESTGRTPGVSCIEAAFGHNELVVGGFGPVDRYFVGRRIHKIVVLKNDRLVPSPDGKGLIRKDNPSKIRNTSALDRDTLLRLHDFYQQLKPFYGGHIDGEFTRLDLVNLLQVRPLPQGEKLKPTYLNIPAQMKAEPMVPADCRVRIVRSMREVHFGPAVGEARQTFLMLSKAEQNRIKLILVSTPGGSNSHEATEFRANNLPVLCLPKNKRQFIKYNLENEQKLLLIDVASGKISAVDPLSFETNFIAEGWSKHPLPKVQSIMGKEGLSEGELNEFIDDLYRHNQDKLPECKYGEILEKISSPDLCQRLSAMHMIFRAAYSLCKKFKKSPLEERALAVARQLISDSKDVWDAHKKESGASQIEKLYHLNWLEAVLKQESPFGVINADSPLTLLSRHKELEAAQKISTFDTDMLSVMLRVGNYGLNKKVRNDWRSFCSSLFNSRDKEKINQLAHVLYRIASLGATAHWLHALFIPKWRESKNGAICTSRLVIETARSIDAIKQTASLRIIAERLKKLSDGVASAETFDKYWRKSSGDLQKLDGIPKLYSTQNSFGRSLLLSAVEEVVESLDGMIKEMLSGKGSEKVKRLKTMLRPFLGIMHQWLKLIDVPGHENVLEINEQIAKIAENMLKIDGDEKQLNISPRFNVSAAQAGSGANFGRHQPKTLADLYTLAHQNILFALAYLKKQEDVFTEHLPTAVSKVANALASTEMLNFQLENEEQRFAVHPPSLISVKCDFPTVAIRYNAPQRNHSAVFDITATLNPKNQKIEELKVGARLFGYQAHDMPRMPWAAAYAELLSRAGGFGFSPEGAPTYDQNRDMVMFTWAVDQKEANKFAKYLPDYLALITTSLYTGSRSRKIPIPGGKKNFRFTGEWGLPKLAVNDNNTTLSEYYRRSDVDLDKSSKVRLREAVENIKRIHPEWDSTGLCPTDLKPINAWHKLALSTPS